MSGIRKGPRSRLSPELLSVLAVQCLLIVPLQVISPWWSDDVANSSLRGDLVVEHTSLLRQIYVITKYWMLHEGRFYPLHYLTLYSQFYVLTDRVVYKSVLALWCLLATTACWWMLREFGLNRAAAALVALLAIASMELRFFHDSLVDHAGVVPLTFAQLCVSLAFFDRWLREERRRQMVASAVFLLWSLLTYETGYLFFVVFALVARRRREGWRSALLASAVPIGICVVVNIIAAGLRTRVPAGDPYAPNFALIPTARTFVDQFTGALPFVYAFSFKFPISAPYDLFGRYGRDAWTSLHPIDLLGGTLVAALAFGLLQRTRAREWGSPIVIGFIGLAMWALAAAPIAITTRYQEVLHPGVAFLPVFLESFGWGVVAVSVVVGVQRRFPATAPALSAVVALGMGGFATLDHRTSVITEHAMYADQTPERVIEQRGRELLATVPQRATLVVDPQYGRFIEPGFFWQHAGKAVRDIPATPRALAPAGGPATGCGPTSRKWELRQVAMGATLPGLWVVGCVRRIGGVQSTRATMTVGRPGSVDITGHVFDDPTRGRPGYSFTGPVSQVFRRASKDDWLPPAGTDAMSLTVIPAPPVPILVPGHGCYMPGPDGSFGCQRHATFEAENLGSSTRRVSALLDVATFAAGTRSITLTVDGQRRRLPVLGTHGAAIMSEPFLLRPGQRETITASVAASRLLDPTKRTVMVVHDSQTTPR